MSDAPITEAMTDHAVGTWTFELEGRTIQKVYEVPDSESRDILLLLDNGKTIMLSCDTCYADDDIHRIPDKWELCMFDATDTPAGKALSA